VCAFSGTSLHKIGEVFGGAVFTILGASLVSKVLRVCGHMATTTMLLGFELHCAVCIQRMAELP